jgi:hypothetical protein
MPKKWAFAHYTGSTLQALLYRVRGREAVLRTLPFELAATERIPSGGPRRLPIHDCRTSKPSIPPSDVIEPIDRIEHTALMAQAQHACIVRSYVDGVSNSHTARKLELARSDGCPCAARCTPALAILAHRVATHLDAVGVVEQNPGRLRQVWMGHSLR